MTNLILGVIAALCLVESGGRAGAVGDGGRAVGILQMWPIAVREANRLAGSEQWTLADRADSGKSRAMAWITLAHHYRRGVTNAVDLAGKWRNPYSVAPLWYRRRVRAALARGRQ